MIEQTPIPYPFSAGLDLRSQIGGLSPLACRRLEGIELLPVESDPRAAAARSRVLPRRPLRRFGARGTQGGTTLTPSGPGGGLGGTGAYRYVWVHSAGTVGTGAVNTTTPDQISVSGYPTTASTTVAIYRTTGGGSVLKLVVAAHDATSSPYVDTTADGALGATINWSTAMHAIDSTAYAQGVFTHWLGFVRGVNETSRYLMAITDSSIVRGQVDVYGGELLELFTGGASSTTRPALVAVLGDCLWLAKGSTALRYVALSDISAGLANVTQPAVPTLSGLSQVAGALTAVTGHIYVVVRRDDKTGVRSLPSAPTTAFSMAYAAQRNQFTISTVAGTTCEIYRTSDGGQFYQYLKSVASGGAVTDEAADSTLSTETVSLDVGAPQSGWKFILEHKGLLVGGNRPVNGSVEAAPNLVAWSSDRAFNWIANPLTATDYEREVDPDDGDELMMGKSFGEVAVLAKRRRVYLLTGDPPKGFRVAPVSNSEGLGCVAPRTMISIPAGLFWLSPVGPVLMRELGAPPEPVGGALQPIFVEPDRQRTEELSATVASEPSVIRLDVTNATAASVTRHVQVQLDDSAAFGSVNYDWVTTDAAERPYFTVNGGTFPSGGHPLAAGQRARVVVTVPSGPTAGTAYYVRWRSSDDGGSTWSAWATLTLTFAVPADDPLQLPFDWENALWAFAVHYPPRREVWLWLPRSGATWCDRCYVWNYETQAWSGPHYIPATAACMIDSLEYDGRSARDYLCVADPDGLLWLYPELDSPYDRDTRQPTIAAVDRSVTATHSSGTTLTCGTAAWPTAAWGLKGCQVVAVDSAYEWYVGIVTANTATALTVLWLGGRVPANTTLTVYVGARAAVLETGWLSLSGDRGRVSILRELGFGCGPAAGSLLCAIEGAELAATRPEVRGRHRETVPIGRDFPLNTIMPNVGGRAQRIRIGSTSPGDWEIAELRVGVEDTGGRW